MSKLTNIMRILFNNKMPLEEVSNKAKFFLKPQISHIEEHYDYRFSHANKYSVVDLDSLAYTIAIAEELSKYRMGDTEWITCLLDIFGEDYSELFTYLFNLIDNREGVFSLQIEDARDLAITDVNNGMINCSNYLVSHAEGLHSLGGDLESIHSDIISYRNSIT